MPEELSSLHGSPPSLSHSILVVHEGLQEQHVVQGGYKSLRTDRQNSSGYAGSLF